MSYASVKNIFPLFSIFVNKNWLGGGGEAWRWRRRLWAWKKELVAECVTLLHNVTLQSNVSDQWQCTPTLRGAIQCVQVWSWIGVSRVDHQSLRAHFPHFTHYLGGLRARRSFLQLL
ncbi:hypothetical protein MtrunA17_Chr5g0431031 [Medicago truncatula]|uniref:Uncharacterized protein n=1 Tax=Medicago truncatula TaxID=3880 RepID=G7K766_MEDTR|nr:hypothetical protein MTR_5g072320 [Medicago truncatula]RHN56583.1 hypothetical protein MtrunA17_Chr5g0431031 [Medicago truncatula]